MKREIAIIAYNTTEAATQTADAVVMRDILADHGYSTYLIHQWSLDETNASWFKEEKDWRKFDGVVIAGFYGAWNLRELIRAEVPVLCANGGYADDLGLGEVVREHTAQEVFNVIHNQHPVTDHLQAGPLHAGAPIWVDAVSARHHHVEELVHTLGGNALLTVHKNQPLVYWGWYRMSQSTVNGPLHGLFLRAAEWVFQEKV